MRDKLLKRFTQIELLKKDILTDISTLTDAELNKKESEKIWSISQVVNHLIISETLSVNYIKKKILLGNENPNSGMLENVKSKLLKITLRLPLKYKAPKVVAIVPEGKTNKELAYEWDNLRIEMKEILVTVPSNLMNKKLFKHPVIGKVSLENFMEFLEAHISHHLMQIKEIKTKLNTNKL